MARLVLLRHGESQWNLENRFTGWVDVPLSPRGIQEAKDAGEKLRSFIATQDHWEFPLLARKGNVRDRPVTAQRVAVQEAESAYGLVEPTPGTLLFFDEVTLILANMLWPELFGRALKVACEQGDAFDVGLKSLRGVVAKTEVLEVALT